MRAFLLLILATIVSTASCSGYDRWRKFVHARVYSDGLEFFDFEVDRHVFQVTLTLQLGSLKGMAPPNMLVKYGSIPTSADDYEYKLQCTEDEDFYSLGINTLQPGTYFVAVYGGTLYNSLNSFTGKPPKTFFFLSVWNYICNDLHMDGSSCETLVLPGPVVRSHTFNELQQYHPDNDEIFGCLDTNITFSFYTLEVSDPAWELTFTVRTDSPYKMNLFAAPNVGNALQIMSSPHFQHATIPQVDTAGTRDLNLTVIAPKIGTWTVVILGTVRKTSSCAFNNGTTYTLAGTENENCQAIQNALTNKTSSNWADNLCNLEIRRLNQRRAGVKRLDDMVDSTFRLKNPIVVKEPSSNLPAMLYEAKIDKRYAATYVKLTTAVSANVQYFSVYVRVGAMPTFSNYDYRFDSRSANDISLISAKKVGLLQSDEAYLFSWDHIVYPRIGRWFLLFVASKEDLTSEGVTSNGTRKWGIDLRLNTTACPHDSCSGHGDCTLVETYDGMTYGSCECHYGFAGPQCEAQTIEEAFRVTQIMLLALSNAAIMPVTMTCFRRKLYLEGVLFGLAGLLSGIYHACDTEIVCILPYHFLQQMDFAFSFNMVLLVTVHFSGARKQAKAGMQIFLFIAMIFLASNDATSMVNWIVIGAIAVLQLVSSLFYYLYCGAQRMDVGIARATTLFFRGSDNFDLRHGFIGSAFWFIALCCWFFTSAGIYWLTHTLWHINAMIATNFLILTRKRDRYRMCSEDGVDVLASGAKHLPVRGTLTKGTVADINDIS